jgi:membrane associated rhomboid family serine protease
VSDRPTPPARQPILNVPPATKALLIVNVAVHVLRLLLPADLDDALVSTFAFVPARYTETGGLGWPALVDPITYQFLHGSLVHLGVNMLALLAFGAGVERRIGGWRMLIFFLVCGVAAAAAHLAAYPSSLEPIVGASGAISGLFGGVLRFQFGSGAGARRGFWLVIILWIVANVVVGQTGMPGTDGAAIAWVAHLGGFGAGLLLFDLAARGKARDRS